MNKQISHATPNLSPNLSLSPSLTPNLTRARLNSKGVSMLEFALVMPFFILLVFGLIDISRYFAYQAILNKGAENGINLATKIPNLDLSLIHI